MDMKHNHRANRMIAMLIVLAVVLQYVPFLPMANAAGQSSMSWTSSDDIVIDSMNLELAKELRTLGSGRFSLSLTAAGTTTVTYDYETTPNGEYYIFTDGLYVIEIHGGTGGNGNGENGGTGGAGGTVYAAVYLKKGQVLNFALGGNGYGNTAGANGGGSASTNAGGGGGYSVVYLLDSANDTLDTNSDYILIAGGGGGGGSVTSLSNSAPDGGGGGNMSSTSGTVSDGTVPGTWYAGSDGSSSGSSNQGIGGTSTPGSGAGGEGAAWANGGTGGSGDNRGGGGGGGYTGGGGGSTTLFLAIGGGGGGASFVASTVNEQAVEIPADYQPIGDQSANGGSISITFAGGQTQYLQNAQFSAGISEYFTVSGISVSAAGTLASHDSTATMEDLGDGGLTYSADTGHVTGTLDLKENIVTVTLTLEANYTTDLGEGIGFGGGNYVPVLLEAFVKVHEHTVYFDSAYEFTMDEPYKRGSETYVEDPATDRANVPLNFQVIVHSYGNGDHDGKTVADLYDDPYGTWRASIANDPFISSISDYTVEKQNADSTYTAVNLTDALSDGVYRISYTVTPKDSAVAEVGNQVMVTTVSGLAYVIGNQITSATDSATGITLSAYKTLTYDADKGAYQLHFFVTASQMLSSDSLTFASRTYVTDTETGIITATYEVLADGWYYIEAYGADGGASGTVTATVGSETRTGTGKSGGQGGNVIGLFKLEKGTVLEIRIAPKGADGAGSGISSENSTSYSSPAIAHSEGTGGVCTYITIDGEPLIIAGGGGGGGGSIAAGACSGSYIHYNHRGAASDAKYHGSEGRENTLGASADSDPTNNLLTADFTTTTVSDDTNKYNGKTAQMGTVSVSSTSGQSWAKGTDGGAAGANYLSAGSLTPQDLPQNDVATTNYENVYNNPLADSDNGAGQVRITPLAYTADSYAAESDVDTTITVDAEISTYFTDVEAAGTGNVTVGMTTAAGTDAAGCETTECTITASGYTLQAATDSGAVIVSGSFEVILSFSPKEGFLGGNDVPVLASQASVTFPLDFTMTLEEDNAADYANVALNYDLSSITLVSTGDKYIAIGDSVKLAELYTYSNRDTTAYTWQDDYVTLNYVSVNGTAVTQDATDSPGETTLYNIYAGAYVAPAEKATVIDPVDSLLTSCTTLVYVYASVTNQIEHTTPASDSPQYVTIKAATSIQLTADEGYSLPASITVTVKHPDGDVTLGESDYAYDHTTGVLNIYTDKITYNVEITGTATVNSYTLSFYKVDAQGNLTEVTDLEQTVQYGTDLGTIKEQANNYKESNAPEGFYFVWQWEEHETMPAYDLKVYGYYETELTVNYKFLGGSESLPSATVKAVYGFNLSEFVPVPDVEGYKADAIDPEQTVTEKSPVTVTYRKEYTLTVHLRDPLGNVLEGDPATYTMYHGRNFLEAAPTVPNHTLVEKAADVNQYTEGENISIPNVDGTVLEITLLYQGSGVCYVTVEWGTLVYSYDDRTGWDPAAHHYTSIPPENAGSNWVKITNNQYSACAITATLSFAPADTYNVFVTYGADGAQAWSQEVGLGGMVQCDIWLGGVLTQEQIASDVRVVGTCTVTISKKT